MLSTFFNCLIIQLFLITIVIALQKNQPSPSSTLFEDYDDDNPINSPSSNNNNNNDGHSKIANENFSNEASPNNNDEYIGDSGGDGKLYEDNEQENLAKTKFSDERFARLFPSRGGIRSNGRYDDRRLMPKEIAKPKPTLPSFIKSTPPLIKLHITTPSPLLSSNNSFTLISLIMAFNASSYFFHNFISFSSRPSVRFSNSISNSDTSFRSNFFDLNVFMIFVLKTRSVNLSMIQVQ